MIENERHVTRTAELPDLGDEPVTVIFDLEGEEGRPDAVLRVGKLEIWRRGAWFACRDLFRTAASVLLERYAGQVAELAPAKGTELYLWGDDYDAPGRVNSVRRRVRRKHRSWLRRRNEEGGSS
jgi:hypothetical protein